MSRDRLRWEIAVLCAALVLIVWQLFVPPALSVANNNDFQKLAGPVCLGPDPRVGNELFDYANLHWVYSAAGCIPWAFHTSAELALAAAAGLNRVFGRPPQFDLRWMGLVYALLFLANLASLQRVLRGASPATSRVLQIALLFAICNAVYIPMFSTFYFDTMALVMVIGALAGVGALVLRERVELLTMLLTAAVLALLAASKGQHSFLALAALPALWVRRRRKIFPAVWARAAGSAAVIACAALALGTIPPEYAGQATYNTLFYRILPASPDRAALLAETRIPPSYLAAVGSHSFSPGSPNASAESQAAFARMFGPKDLALFFARHPDKFWFMLMVHLDEASLDRVRMKTGSTEHRLANYERSTGKPPQSLSHFFCLWPALKQALIAGRPRVYLLYILAVIGGAWTLAPRTPGMRLFLGIVTAMLAASFGLVMLDGLDSGRHLQMFNYLLDLVVCGIAALAVERYSQRRAVTGSTCVARRAGM